MFRCKPHALHQKLSLPLSPNIASPIDKPSADMESESSANVICTTPDTKIPVYTEFKVSGRFLLAFTSLALLSLMVALDGTSISVALPSIARKVDATAVEAFWAGTGYLLTATVFQPCFASLSNIFGRMSIIMVAINLFLVGLVLASGAKGPGLLLAGRAVQGIGGGGIITLTEIVATDLVPLRQRGKWQGILAAMWSLGSVSGPVIGGALVQTSWRWIFWMNLPFVAIGLIIVPLFLRLQKDPAKISSKLHRFDWLGAVIFVGSATSLIIPMTWGGVLHSWSSWRTLVPLLTGAVGLVGFVLFEYCFAFDPLIDFTVFANRTSNIAYLTTALHGTILWCLLYYQPFFFEAVKGYSPVLSGVALFPATFTVTPVAIITGCLITKTGSYYWSIWTGWAMTTLGLGLLNLLDVDSQPWQWIFICLVPGIGLGLLFPALQFELQASVRSKDMTSAVAMFTFFRSLGQTLGVALGGVVFQNRMELKLRDYPQYAKRASALAKDAAQLVDLIKQIPEAEGKLALRTAYVESLRGVYIFLCILAAISLALTLLAKMYDLDVEHDTEQRLLTRKPTDASPEASADLREKLPGP